MWQVIWDAISSAHVTELPQGLKVPAMFGAFLPDWLGFATMSQAESSTPSTARLRLQSMQITFNSCAPVWTDVASILSSPTGVQLCFVASLDAASNTTSACLACSCCCWIGVAHPLLLPAGHTEEVRQRNAHL